MLALTPGLNSWLYSLSCLLIQWLNPDGFWSVLGGGVYAGWGVGGRVQGQKWILDSALQAWGWDCSCLISIPYSWKEDSVGQNETSACWRPGKKTPECMEVCGDSFLLLRDWSPLVSDWCIMRWQWEFISLSLSCLGGSQWDLNQDTGPETHLLKRTHLLCIHQRAVSVH